VISNNLSKLITTTIFFLIFLAIKEGHIFALLASQLYNMAMVVDNTWDIVNWVCRVTTIIMARQTCTH
jgi:hypothetical protein